MADRPKLPNGFLWVMAAAMPAADARRIDEQLAGIQCLFNLWHLGDVGDAPADTEVELWVHPDDDARPLARLRAMNADQSHRAL